MPLTDPYSLTLPVDPLDTLQNIYSESPSYSPEDDVLQISQEAVAYLKEAVQPSAKKSKTSRVVMSDSCNCVNGFFFSLLKSYCLRWSADSSGTILFNFDPSSAYEYKETGNKKGFAALYTQGDV